MAIAQFQQPSLGQRWHASSPRLLDVFVAALVTALSLLAGYTIVVSQVLGVGIAALAALMWLFTRPRFAAVALAASIPYTTSLAGSHVSVNVSASDVLIAVTIGGLLIELAVMGGDGLVRALRPAAIPLSVYSAALAILLAYHASGTSAFKTFQRFELFLLPALIGAAVVFRWGVGHIVLRVYVAAATCLAVLWPFFPLGQKNPTGQFIADAVIVLIAVRDMRRWMLCLPVLIFGLLYTQSRGAIIATGVGLIAVLLAQGARSPRLLLARVVPLALLTVIAFRFLPESAQERNVSFKTGTATQAQYALHIRQLYRRDANEVIRQNPLFGVGVGQYRAGSVAGGDINTDPHQVLLFQRVEGGPLLEGAFIILVGGSILMLSFGRLRRTQLAPAAVGVTTAIVTHGFVDVYWVRGTPVIGWVLVGMALGQAATGTRSGTVAQRAG